MKREIPLFIMDLKRAHGLGECDFIVCTDKENGFVARMEYMPEDQPILENGEMIRASSMRNGLMCVMRIKRITGSNPSLSTLKNLMKKGMDVFTEATTVTVGQDSPTIGQMINFLDLLSRANQHNLQAAGADFTARQTVINSLAMLEHIRQKLNEIELFP